MKLNGLDLFSGIGGIGIALDEWVQAVAYCEKDRYAQGVLLSRMAEGQIARAPIWDDVATLKGDMLPEIDIIFGGFPCQDISVAGAGKGLEGERSGLVFEIFRLVKECKPTFVFLENVPAIRTRGGERVGKELAILGYDCRWEHLSAQEVGANHKRERWFILAANSERIKQRDESWWSGWQERQSQAFARNNGEKKPVANAKSQGLERHWHARWDEKPTQKKAKSRAGSCGFTSDWWATEPNVGRVVNGLSNRVDRIKCLGNAVVPIQAKTAFSKLIGI